MAEDALGTRSEARLPGHLHRLVAHQAARRGAAPAVLAPGRTALSYRELGVQVDDVVGALRGAGVRASDRVAVALPGGPEVAVALVAVASGAAAVPVDPAATAAEFDSFLAQSLARTVLVKAGDPTLLAPVARARGCAVLEAVPVERGAAGVFEVSDAVPGAGAGTPVGTAEGTDVAFVLHTSGTTGRPKLVPLTHANVLCSAGNIGRSLGLDERDRCLNVLPLFHAHGLMGPLLASLVAGAAVSCPPAFDAEAIAGWLAESSPTWYSAVPTIHQAVLGAVRQQPEVARSSRLRFIRSASAPLPEDVLLGLEEAFGVPVVDSYGMTEASSTVTTNPLPPRRRKRGSVGVSIGCEVAVRSERGGLLGPGEVGEIVLRGPTVTSGYDDPADSAAAFASGWFRTGDHGYLDEDGFLFVTGRIKEIINRGGTKISPAEVDAVLLGHPDVAEAVAFPVPHPTLGEEVGAAVVAHGGRRPEPEGIRSFVAERLAAHKVPRHLYLVDAIPRGAAGKVERRRLAEQFAPAGTRRASAADTPLERTLAGIWADVLGREHVGADEHFFDLGGNSLLMVRVQAGLREALEREVPLLDLFAYPTIRSLSTHLSSAGPPPGGEDREAVAQRLRQGSGRLASQRQRRPQKP